MKVGLLGSEMRESALFPFTRGQSTLCTDQERSDATCFGIGIGRASLLPRNIHVATNSPLSNGHREVEERVPEQSIRAQADRHETGRCAVEAHRAAGFGPPVMMAIKRRDKDSEFWCRSDGKLAETNLVAHVKVW